MRSHRLVLMVFHIIVPACLAGCASVSTSARMSISSTTISYFVRHGQTPTVVFQSGLGDGKSVWKSVIEDMPETVSVFAYDRPGYGDSPHKSGPHDPCTISRELRALLAAAGIRPPYVLVGHSLGGLDMFCYAKMFPEDVVGLVLIDPTHPSHWSQMKRDAPGLAAMVKRQRLITFTQAMRREFDDQEGCLNGLDIVSRLAVPTSFLFSGRFTPTEKGPFERMVRALREQWMLLFTNAQNAEVHGSGHYVQRDAPNAVVEAIQGIIREGEVTDEVPAN